MSHPMWVRGLKRAQAMYTATLNVAPYVGAWIETSLWEDDFINEWSHPMWVRGLKQQQRLCCLDNTRRTLCGCVD